MTIATNPGSPLATLDLVDDAGRPTTLVRETGGRTAIVHFMRSSSCPVCLAHAATLQRMRDDGSLGDAAVVLIAPGGADEARDARSRAARRSPSLMAFASESAHAALGLGTVALLQQSATIVVDPSGIIRSLRTSTVPTGSFSASEVRDAVAEIARAAHDGARPQTEQAH